MTFRFSNSFGSGGYGSCERVEIDEWQIDLSHLMAASGFSDELTAAQVADARTVRLTVATVMDLASRCVVDCVVTVGTPSGSHGGGAK